MLTIAYTLILKIIDMPLFSRRFHTNGACKQLPSRHNKTKTELYDIYNPYILGFTCP